jgi:hypothetical protein
MHIDAYNHDFEFQFLECKSAYGSKGDPRRKMRDFAQIKTPPAPYGVKLSHFEIREYGTVQLYAL